MYYKKDFVAKDLADRAGFSLVEAMIAIAIVAIVASALYTGGINLLKLSVANKMAIESKSLGIQKLEEIVSSGFENIAAGGLTALDTQTNRILFASTYYEVVRSSRVIGHAADTSVESNLMDSAYLEVHVKSSYESLFSKAIITNSFCTLVIQL